MTPSGGIPVRGGPWDGALFWGGCPRERSCVVTLRGGFYRISADGKYLQWVGTR